ncbi:Hypothetical predicted protein [Mytilus galloprovincialis]|uniref:Fibronectin type-III domain-containing protein n=1 Tax=Mytilus galloprovincialis TaxID=29158 RepID=A0A8B6DXH5_MYTGA|nr:Hypothetical predicted protein [Mytilus galloprovincialis]
MPRNFQVVALKLEIIVKWRAGNSGGMLQIFFIEYRNRFESEWNVITAEGKSSEVIDGLQMGTVYFVRMFSRNILGESNTTDEIIIKTGNQHFVIKSCSWEKGVLSSAAVVVFCLCLCVVKATSKRFCLNMIQKRSNRSQSNTTTPETRRESQYDEIDSVYYNVSNVNGRPELALNNTPIEALLSSINSRNIDNLTTDNVETGNIDHDSQIHSDNSTHNLTTEIVSATSSSDDSYLVPSRNYINLEIGFTNTHSHQITESELVADGSSASNSESSETYIKSENQYETLATTNVVEHSYESTIETY